MVNVTSEIQVSVASVFTYHFVLISVRNATEHRCNNCSSVGYCTGCGFAQNCCWPGPRSHPIFGFFHAKVNCREHTQ